MMDLKSPERIVSETAAAFGKAIDILVNNAGKEYRGELKDITLEAYYDIFGMNLRSVVFISKLCFRTSAALDVLLTSDPLWLVWGPLD
jgi:NAD(P)-dependent dehydrogenase (short-subunit alcohol dehydrogenase family)